MTNPQTDLTENWDDDFEFQPLREVHANQPSSVAKDEASASLLQDKKNTLKSDLRLWAEAGPSTPSKRPHVDTENWDEDFQDNTDSPLRQQGHESSPRSRRRRPTGSEHENWDDDFEDDKQASPSKSARWDSSSDEDVGLGFADREEDKTVTSRTRRSMLTSSLANESPPPPVPPIPQSFMDSRLDPRPFPRSPTASVFSVPISGRDSVAGHSYSSTAHLALRATHSSSSFSILPPSPPIHHARERRRLRKKSRPPRVDDNIYELEDRPEMPIQPVTPERSMSPPARHTMSDPTPEATPPSTGKSSLVSRIGSVGKKWGASRKKRASTGPTEVALQEHKETGPSPSRPMSMAVPSSPPSSKGWFFRHGGDPGAGSGSPPNNVSALPLKHEKSVDRLLSLVGFDHDTPSKRRQKVRQGLPPDLTDLAHIRTSSSQPGASSSSRSSSRPRGSRNASYGGRQTPSSRGSSVPRSASASVDDVSSKRLSHATSSIAHDEDMRTPRKGRGSFDPDPGSRSFMGGMRRISLSGKHKRSKASMHVTEKEEPLRPSTSTTATAVPSRSSEHGTDLTPRPPSRIMPRLSADAPLLPPIELQPPSPPREAATLSQSLLEPTAVSPGIDTILESTTNSSIPSSASGTATATQRSVLLASTLSSPSKPPVSPQQAASLGRATQPPHDKDVDNDSLLRRNSLGDLKIPARISQAQVGLRRDLGMVREFANSVERKSHPELIVLTILTATIELRDLQMAYNDLVVDVQALLVETAPPEEPPSRAMSPTLFGLPLPGYRARSSTNPQSSKSSASRQAAEYLEISTTYHAIDAKYRISWECAELLIELGGGTPVSPPPAMASLQTDHPHILDGRKSRERAITLAGDEAKPQIHGTIGSPTSAASSSASAQWRASTGRHDLSQRQLILLRDMLNNAESSATMTTESNLPPDVNRAWHWGDGMSSTITLPSEYSSQHGSTSVVGRLAGSKHKSGRSGMRALRDMLRSLKKSHTEARPSSTVPHPAPASTTSFSLGTASSLNLPKPSDPSIVQRRRAKTSAGPESISSLREHPNSPYVTSASLTHKASPRRPSLASLFKLGQKSKSSTAKSSPSSGPGRDLSIDDLHTGSSSSCHATNEEEDWDQVESASDLEAMSPASATGSSTVRRRKHRSWYTPPDSQPPLPSLPLMKRTHNASQTSITSLDPPVTPSKMRVQLPPLPTEPGTTRSHARSTKLSDVKELAEMDGDLTRPIKRSASKSKRQSYAGVSNKRPSSRSGKGSNVTGSLRSPPPQLWPGSSPPDRSPDSRYVALYESGLALAMTPENIRPLLENAKEVYTRCNDCIGEMRQLLATHARGS